MITGPKWERGYSPVSEKSPIQSQYSRGLSDSVSNICHAPAQKTPPVAD